MVLQSNSSERIVEALVSIGDHDYQCSKASHCGHSCWWLFCWSSASFISTFSDISTFKSLTFHGLQLFSHQQLLLKLREFYHFNMYCPHQQNHLHTNAKHNSPTNILFHKSLEVKMIFIVVFRYVAFQSAKLNSHFVGKTLS